MTRHPDLRMQDQDRLAPADEARFRRLLRWYPRAWRARHGEVLIGTLLDQAEHEGRTAPSAGEAWAVAANGVGLRLDRRLAFWAALAALAAGVAVIPIISDGVRGVENALHPVLATFLAPGLAATSAVALAAHARLVAPIRALLSLAIGWLAFAIAGLAQAVWSVSFDLADAGVEPTGIVAWFWQIFFSAWVVGALALGLLVDGMLTPVGRIGRWIGSALVGIVGALAIGLSLIAPAATIVVSIGLAIGARPRRATEKPPAAA